MRAAVLLAIVLAQLPYSHQAFDLARSRDDQFFEAFNRGYDLTVTDPLDHAEIITEFRRAVTLARDHARQTASSMTERDLETAMAPYEGRVGFVVTVRLNPHNTYMRPPLYDIYVETGPATKPLAAQPLTRSPVNMGSGRGTAMVGVRIDGLFPRAGIAAAAAPALVVMDDKANVLAKLRIDLSRYR
jgi:hypothetical protein